MSANGMPTRRIRFASSACSLLILLLLAGCGRTEQIRVGERALLTGTLERGTEGGLFLSACRTDSAHLLVDPEGYLDQAGGFASVYTTSAERDGRTVWQVLRVNYAPIEGFGCGFDWEGTMWSASGNEPFWSARVEEDGLSLRFPERDMITQPVRKEQGPVFIGDGVSLTFTNRKCVDTMADTDYGWVTHLEMNGVSYRGCGFQGMAEQPADP